MVDLLQEAQRCFDVAADAVASADRHATAAALDATRLLAEVNARIDALLAPRLRVRGTLA